MFSKRRSPWGVWLVMALFMVSICPAMAWGSNGSEVTLGEAIQIVKTNFQVPEEYQEFSSGFSDYNNRQVWNLTWRDTRSQSGGYFNAHVDAGTGEIVTMASWQGDRLEQGVKAELSPAQAREIAQALLQQLAPQRVPFLQELPDNQLVNLNSQSPVTYRVRWQRVANQIPVQGDGAEVEIDLANGQVRNYSLRWSHVDLPDSGGIINQSTAEQAFKDAGMLEVQYLLSSGVRPLSAADKNQAILIYRMTHKSAGVIDAITGLPWDSDQARLLKESLLGGAGGAGAGDQAANDIPLTPEEEAEIDVAAQLITQEEAVQAIQKWIQVPEGAGLHSANLEKDWSDKTLRIWSLYWSPIGSDYNTYLSGRINASNGEILSFSLDSPRTGVKEQLTLDNQEARQIAEQFLQKIQPQRFAQSQFIPEPGLELKPLDTYEQPIWYLQWIRTENGIKCPDNGFSVGVDRATKQVTSYHMNWTGRDFPGADGIMNQTQAAQAYLDSAPLALVYTPIYGRNQVEGFKLVYAPLDPAETFTSGIIGAFKGEPLDGQGQPLAQLPQAHTFDDIAGHYAEKEITLLGKAGFMGEYRPSFRPQENITAATLLRTMLGTRYGLYTVQKASDQEVIQQAVKKGWLKETVTPDTLVNRELLAQAAIRSLGLGYLAEVPDIYRYPFQDQISSNLEGYVTLCWGLGIMKGDGQNFHPDQLVSRAEAAMIIIRLQQ